MVLFSSIKRSLADVERMMLDRMGKETGHATSLVRFAPDSEFSPHEHPGGEEFFVLEGVFSDEHRDYPAGCYVRNPIGSKHTPHSKEGCTIFVKLWQFDPGDRNQFSIDMNSAELRLVEGQKGISASVIHQDERETVSVEKWAFDAGRHLDASGGAELLVLDGLVIADGEELGKHSWLRVPPGEELDAQAGKNGARVWIKTGHLRDVTAPQVSS